MASSTAVSYQFMPWVRRGLTVALPSVDNLGIGPLLGARAVAPVGVTLAGANAGTLIDPLQMNLHGPGDVIAIDTRLVLRTDPKPNARNFEPNYLAIVDFDPPDFPWMLTPASANADDRLRPWLVLVVLDVGKTRLPLPPAQGPLPTIRVKAGDVKDELPGLAESWSWAHAQVVSSATGIPGVQADLQHDPASNASRLVCPRRLEPNKDYVACVVPAFEPGRLRGLGLAESKPAAMATLAPAWDTAVAEDVLLPVYFHWEFSTGPAGDFESLARRLRTPSAYRNSPVGDALAHVGTAPMGVDDLLNGITPGLEATMEGALVPLSYAPGSAPDPTQADSLATIVNTPQENVVNPVGDGALGAAGKRLEVKPPMVGGWHAKKHQVAQAELGHHWLADLNLSPRYRGAAGYGAEVVRQNQDAFVDAAWDQIGEILDAEMKFNLTRLAIEAQRALKAKHFDTLPPERLLQVMGPALPRIEALAGNSSAYRIGGAVGSLGGQIDRSSLPAALTDAALRRATSPQRRTLRMAARLTKNLAALPLQSVRYVGVMATASTKAAAFSVNAFLPDGVLSTKAFDKVDLNGADGRVLDLASAGLGRQFTVGQVKQLLLAARRSTALLQKTGVPELKIRVGQHAGVFTDLHVERFGMLAASAPSVQASDWMLLASSVEALGRRGVEGFLVEAQHDTAQLRFSAMRLDARSGGLLLDRPRLRVFDRARRALATKGSKAALAGLSLGTVRIADARKFNTAGVFAALPLNAISSGVAAAGQPGFRLDDSFQFVGSQVPGAVANVVSITLPPALRARDILNRFAVATRGTQALWRDGYAASRVEVKAIDFGVAAAASIIGLRTQPDVTLRARLASTVAVANLAANEANEFVAAHLSLNDALARQRFMIPALFDRVMAWPKLPGALYRYLAAYDQNAFMPGIDGIPQDLVMLVRVNQYFIDSFMAGANCEMNSELLWRDFPTDLRGTPFQRFWDRSTTASGQLVQLDDMQPMHLWGAQPLGRRVDPVGGDPDRVALLVRGQLLRRYPNTAVYAWKKTPAADTLLKDADGRRPDGAIQTPTFSGVIGADITFFGFEIDHAEIDQWCFVLEEQMTEPRFGFDVAEPVPGQARTGPKRRTALVDTLARIEARDASPLYRNYNAYKSLSWSHIGVQGGAYAKFQDLVSVPNKPFASFPTLPGTPTAAGIAKILLQQPFRAYFIGSDLKS